MGLMSIFASPWMSISQAGSSYNTSALPYGMSPRQKNRSDRRYDGAFMATGIGLAAVIFLLAFNGAGSAQTTPDEPAKSVRISGRVIFPAGNPVSASVRMAQIKPEGLRDETSVQTDSHGIFRFVGAAARNYRIYLGNAFSGYKTPPKTVSTADGQDIDVGDMIYEHCPAVGFGIPKAPMSAEFVGDLKPEQIIIEPQTPSGAAGFLPLQSTAPINRKPDNTIDLPQCWPGPSINNRAEWEGLSNIHV